MEGFAQYISSVGDSLGSVLVRLKILGKQAQHSHWNVKGPNFIPLHDLFGEIYDYSEKKVDTVAERIMSISPRSVIRMNSDAEMFASDDAEENIEAVLYRVSDVNEAIDSLELIDRISENILDEIYSELEKYRWKLEASK